MSKEQEAKELLKRLVEHLRTQKLPLPVHGKEMPLPWAEKAANYIDTYLNGEVKTLDEAFGLKRDRKRPEKLEHKENIGRIACELRKEGKTWVQVKNHFEENENIYLDESTTREYAKKFAEQALIEKKEKEDFIKLLNGI